MLTPEERNILISAARTFNQKEDFVSVGFKNSSKYKDKPWVLFDQAEQSIEDCKQMLKRKVWRLEFVKDGQEYWTKPGKARGTAATFKIITSMSFQVMQIRLKMKDAISLLGYMSH